MNRDETALLLETLEAFERRSFPASAMDAWLSMLANVELQDAMQAARDYFDCPEPPPAIQPGVLRRRAIEARDRRLATLRQVERRRDAYVPPNAEYLRARAALAGTLGDFERPVRRSPVVA